MPQPGRVALVTGAGSGIGRATADAFYDDGYAVAALDRNVESVQDWASDREPHRARAVGADVASGADVEAAVAATVTAFGRLDVLVNNAGIQLDAPVEHLAEDTWRRVLHTNLTGTFLCAKYAIPHLRPRRGPSSTRARRSAGCTRPGWPATPRRRRVSRR